MKVLLVEDEPKVASFIKEGLEEQHFHVDMAHDGTTGEKLALSKDYSVIILDVILPEKDGISLCKSIKAAKPHVPVLLLTALGTTENKVNGFEAGADDYLVKPFAFQELLARLKALSKRNTLVPPESPDFLSIDNLKLDLNKKVAIRDGKTITLTAKEFLLLEFFLRNKGRVIPRAEISEKVWDVNFDTGTNVVEVYVNILRKKIDRDFEPKLIHTRVGLGYLFTDKP